jgi:hypothetical protein
MYMYIGLGTNEGEKGLFYRDNKSTGPSTSTGSDSTCVGAEQYLRPPKKRSGSICSRLMEYIFSY